MLAQDKDGKVRLFSSSSYQAGSWRIPRRVVFKAEITECGPNPRYVVTNLTSSRPSFIYEKVYIQFPGPFPLKHLYQGLSGTFS